MNKRLLAVLVLIGLLGPIGASAQTPSYATTSGDAQIRGRVVSYNGRYSLTVRDEKGYVDHVKLHEGTIINPTGLTLEPGMVVSILGYNAGSVFDANDIDTPYNFYGGVPYYEDHPWSYYGAGVGLGFFFDNTGWWHGAAFHGPYDWSHGARVYHNVNVHDIYHAHPGGFHGRDFVAPHASGGFHAAPHFGGHVGFHGGGHAGGHGGGHPHR